MNCPQCGEVCRCQSEPLRASLMQSRPSVDSEKRSSLAAAEITWIDPEGAGMSAVESSDSNFPPDLAPAADSSEESESADAEAWRDELSARLNRYRSRRKVRPPRYPSLSLRFEPLESAPRINPSSGSLPPSGFEPVSNQALALDGVRSEPSIAAEADGQPRLSPMAEAAPPPIPHSVGYVSVGHGTAKIIEFPRFAWAPPPPPPDQLAEPVSERPRILDVPEVAPPPPALGGIIMEGTEHPEEEKRPGIDIPLQSAPLGLRIVAALVDGIIVAAASALFGFIFWKIDALRPPQVQLVGLAAGIPCLFWATYQYLLVVYSASTPGLRLAGLELARFDGTSTTRSLRRWRVLAGWLSAVSLGMGYAWVFLDEDALCWHDRITHTYMAPKKARTDDAT
jgi:uncharacterized RDD family membrane protein YckC